MWEEDLGFKVILGKQSPGSVWAIRVPISNRNGFLLTRNHTVIWSVYHWAYRCPACAIIQRFSLHGKTGGYNPSESGSPGALQEHGGGGHECVERWRKQEPYPVSSSLVRPQDITARDQAVPDGLSCVWIQMSEVLPLWSFGSVNKGF